MRTMKTMTQYDLGRRISKLRKNKGYSQDELAKVLNISRSSITQIELGKRNLSVIELKNITEFLNISIDKFLAPNFELSKINNQNKKLTNKNQIRISIPKLKVEKFKNILLYILERCAGKPNVGETVLYKLLYFSDFNYYELYEEHLSGAQYKKLPFGPVPQKLDLIINDMIDNKLLQRLKFDYHGYPQTRYIPLRKPDLTQLKASEKEIIDRVIDQYSDWSAAAISDFSHKDMPWLASEDGETIDYELVFYREVPYSVRNYGENEDEL